MLHLDKEINNILFLKKQIKYELSHKGGAIKTKNFVNDIVNKNTQFIGLSFYIYITTIIYITLNYSIKKNPVITNNNIKYIVGGKKNNSIAGTISLVINSIINIIFGVGGVPILIIFSILSILLLLVILFLIIVLDFGLYIPCGGCQTDSTYMKCIPGTGANSITCTSLKEILKVISAISNIINNIKKQIKIIKNKIKSALYKIKNIIKKLKKVLMEILGFPLGILYKFFSFLKVLKVSDKWGFNLGKLLLGGKTKNIIFDIHGKLKKEHGANLFLKTFFKILRILLETPVVPKLKWPSFGGAESYTPNVNPDGDPNNTKPTYPVNNINISTDQYEIKKQNIPVPNISNYNKYDINIETNESKNDSENKSIIDKNTNIRQKIKKISKEKALSTEKLIDETNETLKKIKNKKQLIALIISKIKETEKIIDNLLIKEKKLINDISKIHRPHFEKIANIGSIKKDGQSEPSEIKISNGLYILVNINENDLSIQQKESFYNLNKNMQNLNNINKKIKIYESSLKTYTKNLEIQNNKMSDTQSNIKDFMYIKFLKMLIQVEINPLLWITKFVNFVIIKPLNIVIKNVIIKPCIKLVTLLFIIAKKVYKAIVVQLYKVGKSILIPIYKMVDAFKPIIKVFYRVISIISEIGIFNMIFYYFYDKVEKTFSFIKNIFVLLLITILICSILIGCPIIGGYYESFLFISNIYSVIWMIFWEISIGMLIKLYNFLQSLGPAIMNIFIPLVQSGENYISESSNNNPNISNSINKSISIIYYIITTIITISIIIAIIFIIIVISNNKVIKKFIINNTSSLKNKIYKKINKKSKQNK